MQPETTAPIAVPPWATDDVVNFILDAKEQTPAPQWQVPNSKPVQVDLNPQPAPEPPVPDQQAIDQAATEEKLRQEIQAQKEFDEEADKLMKELELDTKKEDPKDEPKNEKNETKKEEVNNKKEEIPGMQEALWKISSLSVEEQEEFIMFVDELQKSHAEISAEWIKKDQRIADLEYENQLLRESSKKYIEKSTSLEQDEIRNKIPEWISELVVSFKDFSTKNDDFTRKAYRKELIRAVEKEFKRSLNDYIWDSYIGHNEVISWQESFDLNLPKPSEVAAKQNEKSKLDYMSNLF